MARRPKNEVPPFQVGDTVKLLSWGGYPSEVQDKGINKTEPIYLTVRKVFYVGKQHSESGWLVNVADGEGNHNLKGYDSNWFRKL